MTPQPPHRSSRILIDHSIDNLRSGEGSLVPLHDGRLLLLYSEFVGGGADESEGFIASMNSSDDGVSWSEPRALFRAPPGALNAMGVSVLRLADGRIGCVFGLKYSRQHLVPQWSFSNDEGDTWSPPVPVSGERAYFVVNNDRLIQDSAGNLIMPYALHREITGEARTKIWEPAWNAICGLFYSRNGGETWLRSAQTITHTPEIFASPKQVHPDSVPAVAYQLNNRLGAFQEPGVQELSNGSLMLYLRSTYAAYRCFCRGLEEPWERCEAIDGINTCLSPQTVRRLPGSPTLIMFYNERKGAVFGSPGFQQRTPLSIAFSRDGGITWHHWKDIEGTEKNYCYVSAVHHHGAWYLTYYESAEIPAQGAVIRRNLASLKFRKIEDGFFMELFG